MTNELIEMLSRHQRKLIEPSVADNLARLVKDVLKDRKVVQSSKFRSLVSSLDQLFRKVGCDHKLVELMDSVT